MVHIYVFEEFVVILPHIYCNYLIDWQQQLALSGSSNSKQTTAAKQTLAAQQTTAARQTLAAQQTTAAQADGSSK